MTESRVSIKDLILVPSVITLGITLLRLVGELQNWSPALFGKAAGGGGSLVGISWLIPVLAVYFAVRLVRAGERPASAGKVAGVSLLLILAVIGISVGLSKVGQTAMFVGWMLASLAAVALSVKLWPALWHTLLAYALAARIPVALVMLVAIFGNWGTHYDVAPPDFPTYSPLMKWVLIGLLPQMTIWIFMTVVFGLFVGGLTALVVKPRTA